MRLEAKKAEDDWEILVDPMTHPMPDNVTIGFIDTLRPASPPWSTWPSSRTRPGAIPYAPALRGDELGIVKRGKVFAAGKSSPTRAAKPSGNGSPPFESPTRPGRPGGPEKDGRHGI